MNQAATVRVWDLPTRLFHWALVGLIAFSWWSHSQHLNWHRLSGYTIAALLVFRLWWGIAGPRTARFAGLAGGPRAIGRYLKGEHGPVVGHNPLGGWSVLAMLGLLLTQVTLGMFSVDQDGFESGPLARYVSFDTGRAFAAAHGWVFWGLLALIVLHLVAVAAYALRGQNLTAAMITGRRRSPEGAAEPAFAPLWRLGVGLLLAAATFGVLYWLEKQAAF